MKIVIFLIERKFLNIFEYNGVNYFLIIINDLNEKLLFKLLKIGTLSTE